MEHTGFSKARGLSREFRPSPDFCVRFDALLPLTVEGARSARHFDLFSGRPTTATRKTLLYDENRARHGAPGSPLYDAMPVLKRMRTYFIPRAVEAHLAVRRNRVEALHTLWKESGEPVHTEAFLQHRLTVSESHLQGSFEPPERPVSGHRHGFAGELYCPHFAAYSMELARLRNDEACYRAVLAQKPIEAPEVGPGVFAFVAAYEPQMSGRVGCAGGMLQSCSREMKLAAFGGVPGLHNYDLAASQARGLIQFFEQAIAEGARGISTQWLDDYTGDPEAKLRMAHEVGVSVDTWKRLLCMVMMGATVPKSPGRSRGEFVRALRDDVGESGLQKTFGRAVLALGPLVSSRDAWHNHIIGPHITLHGTNCRGGRTIRNAAGAVLTPSSIKAPFDRKAKVAAFLLQGLEAAFIHSLTVLASAYGFTVIQNEHDGLITLGQIPQEAVERAAERAGLHYARLVEKPFCTGPLQHFDFEAASCTTPPPVASTPTAKPQSSSKANQLALSHRPPVPGPLKLGKPPDSGPRRSTSVTSSGATTTII